MGTKTRSTPPLRKHCSTMSRKGVYSALADMFEQSNKIQVKTQTDDFVVHAASLLMQCVVLNSVLRSCYQRLSKKYKNRPKHMEEVCQVLTHSEERRRKECAAYYREDCKRCPHKNVCSLHIVLSVRYHLRKSIFRCGIDNQVCYIGVQVWVTRARPHYAGRGVKVCSQILPPLLLPKYLLYCRT